MVIQKDKKYARFDCFFIFCHVFLFVCQYIKIILKNRVALCFDFYYALSNIRKDGFYEKNTVDFGFGNTFCL